VVYLFHGFVVLGAEFWGGEDWAADHAGPALPLVTVLAVALALLLAWQPVAGRLSWVVDPWGSLRRRRGRVPRREGRR
jgi:hypothetical protein